MPSQQLLTALGESLGSGALVQELLSITGSAGGSAEAEFVITDPAYGALGDGSANDTAAIQAAIDAAGDYTAAHPNQRAVVVIPPGFYNFTTLTINAARIDINGYGARLEQIAGTGYNQAVYIKGEIDGGLSEYVTIRGLTVDGNYPAVNSTGAGVGFNIRADHIALEDVTCEAVENDTFTAQFSQHTTLLRCISRSAGESAFRLRGDHQKLLQCKAYDWNVNGEVGGNRAILADTQEIDAEELYIEDFYAHMSVARVGTDGILVDCGDGELDGGNDVACGNSGQATQVNGKAAWTINAGHGFAPGDGFMIQESGVTEYDSDVSTDGMHHRIAAVTGEVFVYVVDENRLKLYKNAADAKLQAGGATGRYNLTTAGTGTFYIKSFGGRRREFTVTDLANDIITCTGHGFHTGRAARLTVAVAGVDVLPAGLANVALITTTTDYVSAGANARYWRNKRYKHVTLRNVRLIKEAPSGGDSFCVKINNSTNVLIDRLVIGQTPWDSVNDYDDETLRIGAGCRKVTILNSVLPNGFINNVRSWIPSLEIAHCEIGTQEYVPVDALRTLQVGLLHVHDNTIRFSHAALQTPTTSYQLRDQNIDLWDIHDNLLEAHTTDIARVMDVNDATHLSKSGLVRFYNNTRRNVGTSEAPFPGLSFTAAVSDVITSTGHCLATGDVVYVSSEGTLPGGLSANTKYFVRRLSEDTFYLHTDAPGATDDTNRVNITDIGTLGGGQLHRLHGERAGCALTFAGPRDIGWFQRGATGRQFVSSNVPTNNAFEWQAGDIIWQMNPATAASPGWICTKTGVRGTTAATFVAMPNLA